MSPILNIFNIIIIISMSSNESTDVSVADSGAGCDHVSVGAGSELEAKRKPRSPAQVAAFEKARAKRAANLAALKEPVAASKEPVVASKEPESSPVTGTCGHTTPSVKQRRPRSDKGKKRGRLVRDSREQEESCEQAETDEQQSYEPYDYMSHFVIV